MIFNLRIGVTEKLEVEVENLDSLFEDQVDVA